MKTSLQDIATIQTGLFAKTVADGDIVYLQSRHFDEDGQLKFALHPDLNLDNNSNKHLLKPGDILFAAKGTKNFAALYESRNPPAVASTTFFIIRLYRDNVLPEFLVWYLNNAIVQKDLKSKAIGSAIVSITKSTLCDIEIPIPSIETQRSILKVDLLKKQEFKIKKQLEVLKDELMQYLLLKATKK